VYTSSAAVFDGDGTKFQDESASWPDPASMTSHYARSKLEAEKIAMGFQGIDVVVINPASVQGPGRTTGTAKMFIDYLNGKLRFDVPAHFGVCYTEDCVNGHLLAEAKGEPGQRYILNTATMTGSDAIGIVADIAGLTERPRTLPVPVAMTAATVVEAIAALRRRTTGNCRESIRTLTHPHLYDGSKAERDLGLRYTPLRDALEATVRWYVAQGLIQRPLPNLQRN
jgi:dihydroflavonol-4-reductase